MIPCARAAQPEPGAPPPAYIYPPPAAGPDPLAALHELAALGSFAYSIRDSQKGQPLFILTPLTALATSPYPPVFSDILIRMARLSKHADGAVAGAARDLRPLMIACHQLNVVNALHGNTAVNAGGQSARIMRSTMAWANASHRDWERSEPRLERFNDRNILVPGEPYEQSAETAERLDQMMTDYGSFFGDTEKLQSVSYAVDLARSPFHRKAAEVWETVLFPKLNAAVPARTANGPLVEVGQVLNFDAPLALKSLFAYGMLTFGNPRTPLTNVVVRIQLQNEFGEKGDWYAYLPMLKPGQYVQTALPSTIFRLAPLCLKLEAVFSLISDQGRMTNVPVDTGKKSNGGRSIEEVREVDRQLMPQAENLTLLLPKIAPVCEDPNAGAKGLIQQFGDGRTYVARWKGGTFFVRTLPFDLTTRAITLVLTRGTPTAMQTFQMPARLITEVERGVVIGCEGAGPVTASDPRVAAATPAPARQASPASSDRPPLGSSSSLRVGSLQGSGGLGGSGGLPQTRTRPVPNPVGRFLSGPNQRPEVPDNRPIRLLTSPAEIADFRSYKQGKREDAVRTNPLLMMLTGEVQLRDAGLMFHSDERTVEAEFVLYVDRDGKPWIQVRATGEDDLHYYPLALVERSEP